MASALCIQMTECSAQADRTLFTPNIRTSAAKARRPMPGILASRPNAPLQFAQLRLDPLRWRRNLCDVPREHTVIAL
jgi:hypothetical protein